MKSCIRNETSSAGRRQFSLLNANSVRYSTPRSTQPSDQAAHRLDAAPVAGNARQKTRLRPAAVAIHDDGDVARDIGRASGYRWSS